MTKEKTDHPFQPGVKVAIRMGGYDISRWRYGVVEKIYKTGNFLLSDRQQQWKPSTTWAGADTRQPCAFKTGNNMWDREILYLYEDVKDKIADDIGKLKRQNRIHGIKDRLGKMAHSEFTDAMLDALEAALPPKEKKDGTN